MVITPNIINQNLKTLRIKPRTAAKEKKILVRNLYQEQSFKVAVTSQNI